MSIFDNIYRLHRIHQLISQETTGTPEELAGRFQLQKWRWLLLAASRFLRFWSCYTIVKLWKASEMSWLHTLQLKVC